MTTTKNREFIMCDYSPKISAQEKHKKINKSKINRLKKELENYNKLYDGVTKHRTHQKYLLERTKEKIEIIKKRIKRLEK